MVYKPEVSKDPEWDRWVETGEVPEIEKSDTFLDEPLFVQNEEQKDSGLWSTTSNISRNEYQQTVEDRRQDIVINEWVNKIKNQEITMADVPEYLLLEVRARV
jgi:hypothetical protein